MPGDLGHRGRGDDARVHRQLERAGQRSPGQAHGVGREALARERLPVLALLLLGPALPR